MLRDFHNFGQIKKALKGYTVTSDDNMREVWYSGLGRSPKNSLHHDMLTCVYHGDSCLNACGEFF